MEHLGSFIINHWPLWLALLVILVLTLVNELMTQQKKGKGLTPQAAVALINDEHAVVIDVRDKEAFNQGHIINSIHANNADFEQNKMGKYKNKTIILISSRTVDCQPLVNTIRSQGYQALVLNGGITAWQNADLPLVKTKNAH